MIRIRSPRSVCATIRTLPVSDIPTVINLSSSSEWSGSENVIERGSANAVAVLVEDSGVYVAEEQVRRIVREEIERAIRALALAHGDREITSWPPPLIEHLNLRLEKH